MLKKVIKRWVCGRVFCRSPARICCNVHRFLHFLTLPKSHFLGPKMVPKMGAKMGAKERPQGTQHGTQNDPKRVEQNSCERWRAGASRGETGRAETGVAPKKQQSTQDPTHPDPNIQCPVGGTGRPTPPAGGRGGRQPLPPGSGRGRQPHVGMGRGMGGRGTGGSHPRGGQRRGSRRQALCMGQWPVVARRCCVGVGGCRQLVI